METPYSDAYSMYTHKHTCIQAQELLIFSCSIPLSFLGPSEVYKLRCPFPLFVQREYVCVPTFSSKIIYIRTVVRFKGGEKKVTHVSSATLCVQKIETPAFHYLMVRCKEGRGDFWRNESQKLFMFNLFVHVWKCTVSVYFIYKNRDILVVWNSHSVYDL